MLHKILPILALLTATLFGGSLPKALGDQPGTQLIGESFSQQLCFDNNGTATGFEPQFELVTPAGITLTAASFYGNPTISHQETCTANECNVTNPLIGQQNPLFSPIDGNESYYILDFPIGSFSTEWPQQCMDLTFELESSGDHVQPGNPLDIKTVAVFSLGETPVDDGNYTYGPEHDLTVIPNVYTIEKQNSATEGERATGPKYPIKANIIVDVARDENISNLHIVDDLDGGMQFVSLDTAPAGCAQTQLPSTTSPGGTLILDCSAVTGVLGPDINITYTYYIPEKDENNDSILGGDCKWKPLINLAHATADHDFNNTSVPLLQVDANSTVTAKAITMHKTSRIFVDNLPTGFGPGDIIEYSLTMDVSEYADQANIVLSDVIGDGQTYDVNNPNSYTLSNGINGSFDPNNITVVYDGFTGTSKITFDLSQELANDGHDSNVSAGTTITVTFQTTIDEFYKVFDGGSQVTMGDTVVNHIDLDSTMPDGTACPVERSDTSNTVDVATLVKTIYKINGNDPGSKPYLIHPGDDVTYKLTSIIPVESFHDFSMLDYLPIPFFSAAQVTIQGSSESTTPGEWALGPDNNYSKTPIFSVDAGQNSLTWVFGDDNVTQRGTVIDLLFTVTATNEPMADELTLANIGGIKYKNSENVEIGEADLINIITQQPLVDINKTIISTSNDKNQTLPGYSLDQVDANDTITYKIRLENTGHAIAYDVNITDRFEQDGNLGQGLHSCTIVSTDTNGTTGTNTTGDLFAGTYTVESIDALSYFDVTYDCTVNQDANPGEDINNTATLKGYASTAGGPNFVAKLIESQTKLILTSKMEIVKNIVASSIPDTNPDNNLNQGEIVYFDINVTLGEGTYTNYLLTDDTCTGLTLQSQSANVVINGTTVTILGTGGSIDGTLTYGCEKQAITSGTNTATVTADLMGSLPASTSWAVTAPNVITSKDMSPPRADAGDTVTVNMQWTNDPNNPAYKCSVTDPLDASVFDVSSIQNPLPTVTDYTASIVNGNTVKYEYTGDLTKPCPNVNTSFTVNVRDDVNTSGNLVNEMFFDGKTLPSGHVGEGNTTIEGNVTSEANATLELLSPAEPVKIFTATSENFTDPGDTQLGGTPPVAIGEVMDVQLTFGFYEGTTLNVDLDERFLDGGRLAYIPGTMKISRSNANLFVGNADINTSLTSVAVGIPVSIDDGNLTITDTLVGMHVGDVLNLNNTPLSAEANLTLTFKVKVQNQVDVQAGELISDRGRVRFEDSITSAIRDTQSAIRSGRTFEPLPTITKDVNQSSVQAGTELTYTIKVCNDETNTSNFATSGFNWIISDHVPDDILFTPGSISVNTNGTGATVDTSASSGQDINATINQLDRGECIFISYEAIVQQSAQFGQIMTNTAEFQTTSLPGSYGTAGFLAGLLTQEPGEVNGKRTGTGGTNDLFGHYDATVIMNKSSLNKQLISAQPRYAIGEKAHYRIRTDLLKGDAKNFVINDTLPAGLDLNTADIIFTSLGTILADNNPPNITQVGQVVSFDYGDINVTSIGAQLIIDYNVTVSNVLSNQEGVSLYNDANVTFDDPNAGGGTITVTPALPALPVKVGEPNLEIQKSIVTGAVNAQAGSLVTWEVVISNDPANNAHTTAYAVDWNDTLPSHLANIQNYSLSTAGTAPVLTGTLIPLTTAHLSDNNTTLALQKFDLPVGSTVTITFDSIVTNDAVAGETQSNHTAAAYLSILGADGSLLGGRNSLDCGDDDDNSTLNNYCESAIADLIIDAGLAIDKRIQGTQVNYTIGETVTYEMRVSLIEGVTKNVVLTDTLPAGLRYVSHAHQNGAPSMTYDFALANVNSGSDTNVIIDFGDVNNTNDGNTSNDYIDVELTVLVENVVGNQNLYKPENGDTAGTLVTVTSDANASAVTVPVPITITEPDLRVIKTVTPTISGTPSQALGDIITYHIRLEHTAASTSDAYDVNFTDTLDPGLIYIPGSATGAIVTQNGQVLTFGFAHLAQGDIRNISYKAQIDPNAVVGVDLNNSLDTVFSGLPDANGSVDGGRNGMDGIGGALNDYALHTSVAVTPNADALTPVKSVNWKDDKDNNGLISAGDTLEYNLSVTNNLGYDVGELNVTDTLDENVTLLLNSIQIDGAAVGNDKPWSFDGTWYRYANAGNDIDLSYNIVTNYFEIYWQHVLASGATLNITFDTKINDGNITEVLFLDGNTTDLDAKPLVLPGTVIDNIFTVDSNRTVPTPSNEVNVTTDQRGIVIAPVKRLTATDQPFTDPGDLNLANTPPVAVGEIIDVEILFEFSGGTTRTVVLKDNYDLQHFIYVPNSTILERSSDRIEVSDVDLNNSFASANPISVDDSKIMHDVNGFSLAVGDVFNDNYNAMNVTESLIMRFKLRVDNNDTVQAGVTLNDHGGVSFSEYDPATSSSSTSELNSTEVGVRVVEADVEITKTVNPLSASSGDMLTYTIKVCNDESNSTANTTSAFDWVVTDRLPDELDLVGDPQYNGTSMFSGRDMNVIITVIVPGDCVLLEYNVTVNGSAQFEQDINNTVRVEGTSLPGTVPGERTGTGILPNDLNSSSTAILRIEEPAVTKGIVAQKSYYPIGDIVEYNITLAFTGSARDLTIVDHFPVGLAYVPNSARLRLPSGTTVSFNPPQESANGYDWTFFIGDLNITTAGNLYLELNATVEDIASNIDGVQLTNSMDMKFTDPNTGAPVDINATSPAMTVGEPELHVSKTITTDLSVPKSAGDVISYEITIENNGTTPAYFVEWEDKVPVHTGEIYNPQLVVYAGTAFESNTSTPITNTSFTIDSIDEPDDHIVLVPFDLSVGATLVITFDTIIQPNVIPAETLVNITGATTQSVLGIGARKHTSTIDGEKYASLAKVSFTINQLPEAIDDGCYRVTTYSKYTWDITLNDKLGDGTKAEHTWRLITPPHDGVVTISKDGKATYEPNANYNGPDSFRYEMEDSNGDKSQANVCIDVDCASSQTSDGGDAYSMWTMLTLMFFTAMIGLYYLREEENRREDNRYE